MEENTKQAAIEDLCKTLFLLKTEEEAYAFFKDLCTPQELNALAERWKVCKLLNSGEYSYRDIHKITGASLTTISRVARFLKDEPYKGYKIILDRMAKGV